MLSLIEYRVANWEIHDRKLPTRIEKIVYHINYVCILSRKHMWEYEKGL